MNVQKGLLYLCAYLNIRQAYLATAGHSLTIPAVTLRVAPHSLVTGPRGKRLSCASICFQFYMPWRRRNRNFKCKTVVLSQGPCSPPHISIDGAALQSVDKFCYLGSTVDNTNSLKSELDIRIGKAATTFGQLRSRISSNGNLSTRVKIRVYMACVVSVLLYGCETWTTYRHQERRISGLSWKDRVPNTSILQTTGSYDLITIIRYRRLRWAGACVPDGGQPLAKASST